MYSLSADNWNVLDTGVSRFALASYESKLVLIGGRQRDTPHGNQWSWIYTNKVSMLDSNLDIKDHDVVAAMRTKRASACAASYEDCLIVAGGEEEGSNTNGTVEVYDGSRKGWLLVTPLPKSGIVKSAAIISNSIWCVVESADESHVYCLNLSAIKENLGLVPTYAIISIRGTWQTLPLKPSHKYQVVSDSGFTYPLVCSNLSTYHDQVILMGRDRRYSSSHSFFVYSPNANQWMAVAAFSPKELKPLFSQMSQKVLDNIRLLSISDKELLLLGCYQDVTFRVSFQSK